MKQEIMNREKRALKVYELVMETLKLNNINPSDAVSGILSIVASVCCHAGMDAEQFRELLGDMADQYEERLKAKQK